jgi:hypothetical protein
MAPWDVSQDNVLNSDIVITNSEGIFKDDESWTNEVCHKK